MTATTTQWPVAPRPQGNGRVAANIKAEMKRNGMTVDQLSRATNISPFKLGRRLYGIVPFRIDELDIIAWHLGTTADVLVREVAA